MKRLSLFLLVFTMFSGIAAAQNNDNETLINIAGENISKAEFLAIYNKNNIKNETVSEKSIKDYLELFINYKLKVKEAEAEGLDTNKSFKSELAGYRRQLARPYLSNREINEDLVKEAYERMKTDIHAAHILIKLSENAAPKDTLIAYKKIMKIRKEIVGGLDFGEAAVKYSEDESAKDKVNNGKIERKGNKGDLGYFSALNMIYDFENAAYNTAIGEVSQPIRTSFGYHLIKVYDKQPALGKIQVAHILAIETEGKEDEAKDKIFAAYKALQNNEKFEDVAEKYSDDKGSAKKGGILPEIGSFRMSTDFIQPIYKLKIDEISEPIKTDYGWHIVKLISKKDTPKYEDIQEDLKKKVSKDSRSYVAKDELIKSLKNEYNFTFNQKAIKTLLPFVTDSIYFAKWNPSATDKLTETICTIDKNKYSISEFAQYLAGKQTLIKEGDDKSMFMLHIFDKFAEDKILEYENSHLEMKYPEFKALINEYRDGILLFNLMDSKVWTKAIKDTTGINDFYKGIENNYMYGNRVEAAIFTYTDSKIEKTILKGIKKKLSPEKIVEKINTDSIPKVKYSGTTLEKGQDEYVDKTEWSENAVGQYSKDENKTIVWILKTLEPQPKPLSAVKGTVTAKYQNYLEEQWIKELRNKYKWTVNQDVLKSIYTK